MTNLETYAKHLGDDWAANMNNLIPAYMHAGIVRYVLNGIPAGDFLDALVCNDLFRAVGKADDFNRQYIHNYCTFFHNYAPAACFGSQEKRDNWVAEGGVIGMREDWR